HRQGRYPRCRRSDGEHIPLCRGSGNRPLGVRTRHGRQRAPDPRLGAHRNCRVILPEDAVVAPRLEPGVAARTVRVDAVQSDMMILDIGPETVTRIAAVLEEARTLVWNGPLGAFETPPFDRGTVAVAKKIGELTRAGNLLSVAGG